MGIYLTDRKSLQSVQKSSQYSNDSTNIIIDMFRENSLARGWRPLYKSRSGRSFVDEAVIGRNREMDTIQPGMTTWLVKSGSRSYPVAGFGDSGAEPSGSASRELVKWW
jgi:hypothetical protein